MKILRLHEEALASLKGMKLWNGKLDDSVIKNLPKVPGAPEKITIDVSPVAYMKMVSLIMGFDSEVGWKGTCWRDPDDEGKFHIGDIFVYPQVVTGTTINTDETKHGEWLDSFDDDTFQKLRFHGHSHVNMSVFSSGTDDDLQRDLVGMLKEGDFHLFFIMNKRMEIFVRMYDNKYGLIYETADCTVTVGDISADLKAFMDEAKKQVTKTYTPPKTNFGSQTSFYRHNGYYGDGYYEDDYWDGYESGAYSGKGSFSKSQSNTKNDKKTHVPDGKSDKKILSGFDTPESGKDTPCGYYDKNGRWVSVIRQ